VGALLFFLDPEKIKVTKENPVDLLFEWQEMQL
jgi:hypothetical protein